jgi:hypothetical protein
MKRKSLKILTVAMMMALPFVFSPPSETMQINPAYGSEMLELAADRSGSTDWKKKFLKNCCRYGGKGCRKSRSC